MQKIASITDIKNSALRLTTLRLIVQVLNFLWKIFLKTLLIFINVVVWFLVNMFSPEVIEASIHDSEMRDAEKKAKRKQREYLDQEEDHLFHRKS